MSKLFNVCVKKIYKDRDGKDKTIWPQVGTMRVNDDGKTFIDLPLLGQSLYVFEAKARNEAHDKAKESSNDWPPD